MKCEEVTRFIDAYLDGELDMTACIQVEAHFASCTSCRELLETQRALITLIQEEPPRFAPSPLLTLRVKAALRRETSPIEATFPSRFQFRPWEKKGSMLWIYAGLGGAIALSLFAALIFLFGSGQSVRLEQEAIADHVRSLQVNHLMDIASTDQHTVKPWFAGKLDYSPQVIDLGLFGYPLIGGRLDILDHRNVAALIYQRRKHYINLFVWPTDHVSSNKKLYERDGYHVLRWTKSGMNYLAVSELGTKELQEFSELIQNHLAPAIE